MTTHNIAARHVADRVADLLEAIADAIDEKLSWEEYRDFAHLYPSMASEVASVGHMADELDNALQGLRTTLRDRQVTVWLFRKNNTPFLGVRSGDSTTWEELTLRAEATATERGIRAGDPPPHMG